jgi:hypothetical protein
MAKALIENNVSTTLAQAISTLDTVINVAPGTGARFPAISGDDWFYATIFDVNTGDLEIVKCTGRAGDGLTVERGVDDTLPRAFAVNDVIEMRVVKAYLNDLYWKTWAGVPDGLATLDPDGHVPPDQLPDDVLTQTEADLRYIKLTEKAAANGVATLDATSLVPDDQLPDTLVRETQLGVATVGGVTGVATLDEDGIVPDDQLPDFPDISIFATKVDPTTSGTFTHDGEYVVAGGAARRKLTVSEDAPSGSGVEGDEWYQVEP